MEEEEKVGKVEEGKEVKKVNEVEEVKEVKKVDEVEKEVEEKEIDELSKLKKELYEYKDKYLRTLAEMENLSKRLSKEKEEFVKYASSVLVSKMIPTFDDFEAALKIEDNKIDKNFVKGIKLIYNNLKEVLGKEGLKRQQTVGLHFSPTIHEVVSTVETNKENEDGIIIEELRSGYNFKDVVIRPAMVKIAKKKEVEEGKKSKESK